MIIFNSIETSPFVYWAFISFVDLKCENVSPSPYPDSFNCTWEVSIFYISLSKIDGEITYLM